MIHRKHKTQTTEIACGGECIQSHMRVVTSSSPMQFIGSQFGLMVVSRKSRLFNSNLYLVNFLQNVESVRAIPLAIPLYNHTDVTLIALCIVAVSNAPFTQGLRVLWFPCATTKPARSPLKALRRPKDCLGRSGMAQRTFKPRHGRHGRRELLRMFKTVVQRSLRRSVNDRSCKGGRRKAHTSPWSQNGYTGGRSLVDPKKFQCP